MFDSWQISAITCATHNANNQQAKVGKSGITDSGGAASAAVRDR